jgi:virginiamycin B lyase
MKARGRTPRRSVATIVALLAMLGGAVAASSAQAFVYWANSDAPTFNGGNSTIGRANLNGMGVSQTFINSPGTVQGPCGLAVTDSYLFWGNLNGSAGNTTGRANLDGSSPQIFTTGAANSNPCVGAVDDTYVYWSNNGADTIGRATFDGTTVDQSFVDPANFTPCGVGVTPTDVYWANQGSGPSDIGIGRTPLSNPNGPGKNPNLITLPSGSDPCGVTANSAHVFWADFDGQQIGRANLDGSGLKANFIPVPTGSPCGIAVTDTHIYWGDFGNDTIGRAKLDGSDVQPSFITGAFGPCGVAVDDNVLPTSTSVACARSASAFNQPTTCTATVSDQGPAATVTPPAGTVSFSSASGGAGFSGPSSCTLSPATAGSSRCSVTYLPGTGINLLQGFYNGDPDAHAPSSGIAQTTTSGFSLGTPSLNPANGTGTIVATVPGPGTVTLQGSGLQQATLGASGAGQLTIPLLPDATSAAMLNSNGNAPVSGIAAFFPQGGGASGSQSLSTTLLQNPTQTSTKKCKRKKGKKAAGAKKCKKR